MNSRMNTSFGFVYVFCGEGGMLQAAGWPFARKTRGELLVAIEGAYAIPTPEPSNSIYEAQYACACGQLD